MSAPALTTRVAADDRAVADVTSAARAAWGLRRARADGRHLAQRDGVLDHHAATEHHAGRITTWAPITASSGMTTSGATNSPGARSEATSALTASTSSARARAAAPPRAAPSGWPAAASYLALNVTPAGLRPVAATGRGSRGPRARRPAPRPGATRSSQDTASSSLAVRAASAWAASTACSGDRELGLDPLGLRWRSAARRPTSSWSARHRSRICRASSPAPVTGAVPAAARGDLARTAAPARGRGSRAWWCLRIECAVDVPHHRVVRREVLAQPLARR